MLLKTNDFGYVGAEDIQSLGDALSEEAQLLGQALDLGLNQRQALIGNNLKELQDISDRQNKLAVELEKVEETRQSVFFKMVSTRKADLPEKKEDEIKCEDLYPFMDPTSAEQIEKLRLELKSQLEHLQRLNEVNSILIKNSRNITQNTIEIITGVSGENHKKLAQSYGAKGKMQSYKKAERNLINRKA